MTAQDTTTYGFNKPDAEELLTHLGGTDESYIEGRTRSGSGGSSVVAFLSHASGIAARSGATMGSATCTRLSLAGGTRATTTNTATIYNNFLSSIGASVDIYAARVDGKWVVISEDCT